MPAPISKGIVDRVHYLCDTNPDSSGRKIHELYCRRYARGAVSSRKVQALVALRKQGFPDEPFRTSEWALWGNADESPEDRAHLLRLDAVCQVIWDRSLQQHEARWGRSLRLMTEGLSPYDQFCFVNLYSQREMLAHYRKEPEIYTTDLDGVLAYRPWLPENLWAYAMAVGMGIIPIPPRYRFDDTEVGESFEEVWDVVKSSLEPPVRIFPPVDDLPVSVIADLTSSVDGRRELLEAWMGDNSIFPPVKDYEPVYGSTVRFRRRRGDDERSH